MRINLPSTKGIDSERTLVMKAFNVGAAVAPDPSLNFSVEEAGLLGCTPFPALGNWLIEIPSKRTQGPRTNLEPVIVNVSTSNPPSYSYPLDNCIEKAI